MLLQWFTERQLLTACSWKEVAFVIYHCVMNYSKTISLSQNYLFICGSGIWSGLDGSSAPESLMGCSKGVIQGCGHLKGQQGKDPITCIKNTSLGSAHMQGGGNTQGMTTRKQGSPRTILEVFLPKELRSLRYSE